jgi:hypothetical protein
MNVTPEKFDGMPCLRNKSKGTKPQGTGNSSLPPFIHRWNTYRAERLFVPTLIPIQTLAQRGCFQSVVLDAFAAFIPVLGLYHLVLDAEFPEPPVQVESERTRLITGHRVTGELLLFNHRSVSSL